MPGSRRRIRLPLTLHLGLALVLGAVLLSAGVAHVAAHRDQQQRIVELAARREAVAATLARRAAALLEQGDQMRLGVLVAATADFDDARVLALDREGVVRADSAKLELGQRLPLLAGGRGPVRSARAEHGELIAAPAMGADGFAGEVRLLHARSVEASVPWPWHLFGLVLLGNLSLAAVACWMAHAWVTRVGGITERVRRLARGEAASAALAGAEPAAELAVGSLGEALDDLASRDAERRLRARDGALRLAREVVHSLERREVLAVGHGERVQRLATALAVECGLDEATRAVVREAAPLLDLGKAGVRPSALTKTGQLDDLERDSLRQHPVRGARLLGATLGLEDVAAAICHQHEKYDGSGFPQGLRGTRIPVASRLLAIVSAFDLLVEGGPGFLGVSWPEALDRLRDDRGEHFDPQLLDAFEAMVRRAPPARIPRTTVTISTAGVVPHRVVDEPFSDDRGRAGDDFRRPLVEDAEEILALGHAELELMFDEAADDDDEVFE